MEVVTLRTRPLPISHPEYAVPANLSSGVRGPCLFVILRTRSLPICHPEDAFSASEGSLADLVERVPHVVEIMPPRNTATKNIKGTKKIENRFLCPMWLIKTQR